MTDTIEEASMNGIAGTRLSDPRRGAGRPIIVAPLLAEGTCLVGATVPIEP